MLVFVRQILSQYFGENTKDSETYMKQKNIAFILSRGDTVQFMVARRYRDQTILKWNKHKNGYSYYFISKSSLYFAFIVRRYSCDQFHLCYKVTRVLFISVVVYLITNKVKDSETDLKPYAERIFDMSGGDQTTDGDKPKVCTWHWEGNRSSWLTKQQWKNGLLTHLLVNNPQQI